MLQPVYGTVVQNKASMWSACSEDQQDPEMPVPRWRPGEWEANFGRAKPHCFSTL